MRTVTKYELIINEAMRSALDYDIPEEQIKEFIRFFGKHIGSDRIYIFEDSKEDDTTSNTYEWCNDGVIPQINFLKGVDKKQIDWWYECFEKGENVVIEDLEDIREIHKESYELLKPQGIKRLVVSEVRYKDEITGFFGVDNPPADDLNGLSMFLDMIGTFLVSLMKLRNSFTRSSENARLNSYSALAGIYLSMHLIDIKTGKCIPIKTTDNILESMSDSDRADFTIQIKNVMQRLCTEKYIESVYEFTDIGTLEKRLDGKNTIAHEFLGIISGWCRERFIKVDCDENGNLWHVLYCVEIIDEEKKRENRLRYLSETDYMTGICNRGCGEKKISELLSKNIGGFLCLIDCDKFKSINDTYGHAVGDKVLIAIADALSCSSRENDIVMRLGGDEFAAYFPGVYDEKTADKIIRRIFDRIDKIAIPEMNNDKIKISLGGSFCRNERKATFDQMYREADAAMYKCKNNDKCHFMIYGQE